MLSGNDKENGQKETNPNSLFNFGWNTEDPITSWLENTTGQIHGILDETSRNHWGVSLSDMASAFGSSNSMVAYKTPSLRQYDMCLSNDGRPVWTEDGMWRCLFKGQAPPSHLKHEFKDYTGFLNYQRDLMAKKRTEEESRMQVSSPSTISKMWDSFDIKNLNLTGSRSEQPRLISEKEAEGKKVVWQSQNSEAITLDDGSMQTRTRLVKYFDDGTALMQQSNDTDKPSSWFWK